VERKWILVSTLDFAVDRIKISENLRQDPRKSAGKLPELRICLKCGRISRRFSQIFPQIIADKLNKA
jgi:hypothetical protein